MDHEALFKRIREERRAKGCNVTWIREDGTPDEWSFNSPERAAKFRANCHAHGIKTID